MICSPCSQRGISRANGDWHSQIEKHVVVSLRSDLPPKRSTVLSEPKFVSPPGEKFLDLPLNWVMSRCLTENEKRYSLSFNCYNARKALEYVIVKRACFRSLLGHAPFNEEICLKR